MLIVSIYVILLAVINVTEKLYDYNAYLKEFNATVISCTKADDVYKVILDKTAFFPEEGGQYSDKGYLNDVCVYDVQIENNVLVHYCSGMVCGNVTGKIDFDRRFRNMQNHTGEHIISGIIHSLFGGENVGFHLGDDEVTCDYDIELSEQQLKTVELMANKAIYSNLPVTAYYPSENEIENITYRSKKEINEKIRIVTVESVDCCACCAPHVKFTGEIGIIKILSSMRLRGGVRLFIACGTDAFSDYALKHDEIKAISALLAAKPNECALGVERLIGTLKAQTRKTNLLISQIAQVKIDKIEKTNSDILIITETTDNKALRDLANMAKEKSGNTCAAFGGNDNSGYSYVILSDDPNITELAKDLNKSLNGRGGGKSPMLQGSVAADKKEITAYFSNAKCFEL